MNKSARSPNPETRPFPTAHAAEATAVQLQHVCKHSCKHCDRCELRLSLSSRSPQTSNRSQCHPFNCTDHGSVVFRRSRGPSFDRFVRAPVFEASSMQHDLCALCASAGPPASCPAAVHAQIHHAVEFHYDLPLQYDSRRPFQVPAQLQQTAPAPVTRTRHLLAELHYAVLDIWAILGQKLPLFRVKHLQSSSSKQTLHPVCFSGCPHVLKCCRPRLGKNLLTGKCHPEYQHTNIVIWVYGCPISCDLVLNVSQTHQNLKRSCVQLHTTCLSTANVCGRLPLAPWGSRCRRLTCIP